MRTGLATIALWAAMAAVATAADIYVNNMTGNDRHDGAVPVAVGDLGPLRTIAGALERAEFGDRIVLAKTGKPYRESITFQGARHSGLPSAPFRLEGNGATLDGTRPIAATAWKYVDGGLFRLRVVPSTFVLLYLDGKPARRRKITHQEQVKDLKPLEWCRVADALYFRGEPDRLPQSYDLALTYQQTGITLYETHDVEISDLVVQGYRLDGVNAHDGVRSARLVGLTCRGNGRSGISVGGASRVTVEACLVGNNGRAQLRSEGYSSTQVVRCDLLDNTAPKIVKEDGGRVTVTEK